MVDNRGRPATGFQIAFLIVALLLLTVPAEKYFLNQWTWARENGIPVARFVTFAVIAIALFGAPTLRRTCVGLLRAPFPREWGKEVTIAWVLNVAAGFAGLAVVILLVWMNGGDPALARRVGEEAKSAEQMTGAFTLGGILTFLVIGGVIAPIIEEILFRGLLYPAWARQWGWLPSALATSLLFALIHPNKFAQFFASLIYIALFRRTGSLRAPMMVHSLYNTSMWYPLIGQFVFPISARGTGEISYFSFNLVCLALVAVSLPVYLWMSRNAQTSTASSASELAR